MTPPAHRSSRIIAKRQCAAIVSTKPTDDDGEGPFGSRRLNPGLTQEVEKENAKALQLAFDSSQTEKKAEQKAVLGDWNANREAKGLNLAMKPSSLKHETLFDSPANSSKESKPNFPTTTTSDWGDRFASLSAGWKFDTCVVRNIDSAMKCAACGAANPGSEKKASAFSFSLGSAPTPALWGFSFGVPQSKSSTSGSKSNPFLFEGKTRPYEPPKPASKNISPSFHLVSQARSFQEVTAPSSGPSAVVRGQLFSDIPMRVANGDDEERSIVIAPTRPASMINPTTILVFGASSNRSPFITDRSLNSHMITAQLRKIMKQLPRSASIHLCGLTCDTKDAKERDLVSAYVTLGPNPLPSVIVVTNRNHGENREHFVHFHDLGVEWRKHEVESRIVYALCCVNNDPCRLFEYSEQHCHTGDNCLMRCAANWMAGFHAHAKLGRNGPSGDVFVMVPAEATIAVPDPTNPTCRNDDFSEEIPLLDCSRNPRKMASTINDFLSTYDELKETDAANCYTNVQQAINNLISFYHEQTIRILGMARIGEDCCSLDVQAGAECFFLLSSDLEDTLIMFGDSLESVVCQVGYMPPPKAFVRCSDEDANLILVRGEQLAFVAGIKELQIPPTASVKDQVHHPSAFQICECHNPPPQQKQEHHNCFVGVQAQAAQQNKKVRKRKYVELTHGSENGLQAQAAQQNKKRKYDELTDSSENGSQAVARASTPGQG